MAILSALSVTDVQDLRAEANAFEDHANQLKTVTDQMLSLVDGTTNVWKGDAQNRYKTQFDGLQDDMQKIYEMCVEYSDDLKTIATNYENAEESNANTANSLKSDVTLV